ncbi:MAG: arylsulfatase A-like enzyme [Verrucomicrobiales bacterium]|jgi:arylsulfatase A-like enzyme
MRHLGLCLAALLFPACLAAETQAARPNVLFILADDLGIGDLACYGNPHLETPAIDSLAAAGVRLTDHYAPSPLCAPSRAGFLTGRFNHRTGAVDVPSNRGLDRIALSEKTFGDYFRQAGYATALIGKWHNGLYCQDHLPHRRGFDLFFGFPNGGQDYWKWNLMRNDAHVPHDGRYLTDALNDEAIRFIQANAAEDKRFALFLAHHVPHSPFQAPDKLVKKYQQLLGEDGSKNVATIYAMIEAMDIGLARVFETLKAAGLWEETIIVFTSDNGAVLGNAEGGSTKRFHAGFSGNKGDVGEQGIRVPGIVAWPGRIPSGQVSSTPVHGCDWLPTLFSLTGSERPDGAKNFDGLNIMPMLLGEPQPSLESRVLPFQKNRYMPAAHSDAAIRRGRWKLVWPGAPATMRKDSTRDNPSYLRGVVRPHWEMPLDRELGSVPEFDEPEPRLFDLESDPAELHDVAADHPELTAELARVYDDWFAEVMADWRKSRRSILEHDRAYWKNRTTPDPAELFEDFWQWRRAPAGTDPNSADPLKVFKGFWNQP